MGKKEYRKLGFERRKVELFMHKGLLYSKSNERVVNSSLVKSLSVGDEYKIIEITRSVSRIMKYQEIFRVDHGVCTVAQKTENGILFKFPRNGKNLFIKISDIVNGDYELVSIM